MVLGLLPLTSLAVGQQQQAQGEEEDAPSASCCNARRAALWVCGVVSVGLELVGVVFSFAAPDVEVIGMSVSSLVSFITVAIGFLVVLTWAIAGFTFIARMQKAVEAAPRVRSLIRLLFANLVVLCATFMVYAVLVVLYPVALAANPYSYTVTVTLHRVGEFFFTFSMLRMIDGTGDR
jgi:hypothetical protein